MDLPVHGEGGSVRSYLYVTDVAQAYILVLHKGVIGDTYNIGTQKVRLSTILRPALTESDHVPDPGPDPDLKYRGQS